MQALPVLQPICCGPETPPLPEGARQELAERFKALADRRASRSSARPADPDRAMRLRPERGFDLSQPTISHHLRVLREAGLVE